MLLSLWWCDRLTSFIYGIWRGEGTNVEGQSTKDDRLNTNHLPLPLKLLSFHNTQHTKKLSNKESSVLCTQIGNGYLEKRGGTRFYHKKDRKSAFWFLSPKNITLIRASPQISKITHIRKDIKAMLDARPHALPELEPFHLFIHTYSVCTQYSLIHHRIGPPYLPL